MQIAPLPVDEAQRLKALQALQVLDSGPEAEFDALVHTASLVCGVPISLISLVDTERQWFKANIGLPGVHETPRDVAFCAHAILDDDLFVVPDATQDARFADNPLVASRPDIRFYAGAPVKLNDGQRVGTLCVIDRQPRHLDDTQRAILKHLALAAAQALEGRRAMREFRAATMARLESDAKLRDLSEAVPVGVFYTDALGACTYTNPRWQEIYGLSLAQSLGSGWTQTLHPEDRDAVFAQWQADAQAEVEFLKEFRILRPDASVRVVRSRARAVRDAQGEVTSYVGSVEDITTHRELLDQLALNEERLRTMYAATPAMLHTTDMQGKLLTVSATWLRKLGYPADATPQHKFVDLLTRQSRDLALRVVEPALQANGWCENVPLQILSHRGEVLDVLYSAVLQRDSAGQPQRTLAVLDDVTLRRMAERALHEERRRLANVIEGSQLGTWEWHVPTGELRLNARWADILGTTVAELGPLSVEVWRSHCHPEDLVRAEALLQDHFRTPNSHFECEMRMRHRQGHWVWVMSRGRVLGWSADQEPQWMFGTHEDISTRKAQEEALHKTTVFLDKVGRVAGVGGWALDVRSHSIVWSDETCRLHGVEPGYVPTLEEALAFYPPVARQTVQEALASAMATGVGFDVEVPFQPRRGEALWVRAVGEIERQGDAIVRIVGAFQDVTQTHNLVSNLADQHALLSVTLQSIGDAVITTDAKGLVTWLNPVAERMTGWLMHEAQGRELAQVFHILNEETRQPAISPVEVCLKDGAVVGLAHHTVLMSRDGTEYGIEDSAAPIRNDLGAILGAVLVFHDVTEQRRLSGEMSYRATHDALTQLVNRAECETRMRRLLQKSQEDGSEHALLYIDLDQFKLVNDACGHAVGDQLLQQVARLFEAAVRDRDTLARMGGDEFSAVLEHCSAEQAIRVAQQICDRMDEFRFTHDGRRFRIGASIGLVPIDRRWTNTEAIFQAADTACYAAKEAGRNRVHVWYDTDQALRARHGEMQWTTRIEQALDEDRFVLFAQRICPAHPTHEGLHAEILLRMRGEDGELIAPGAFLPAAERFHLASRIDRWVLKHAVAWLKAQPSLEGVYNISVNLSGQSIGDRAFHRWAMEMLHDAGAAVCQRLCLEVTETSAVTNLADAGLFIEQVRALGLRVALDDFGAGASSFGYLKTLKVDYLKIDGQYVRDLVDDPLDDAAVRCFIDVAKLMGLQTVAEFVDKPEVLERLQAIGADYVQGYLLHKPAALDTLLAPVAPVPTV
jgi:diguanylate cyclase